MESTHFTARRILLLVSIIVLILSSFGIQFGPANLFPLGVAIGFAAFFS